MKIILYIIIILIFNISFIIAFHFTNILIIYAISLLNMTIMVYYLYIIFKLIAERNKWKSIAIYDALTSTLNRGIFIQNLKKEIDRAHRYKISLSFIVLDLDHFKYVNDTYGHPVGDLVLSKMCENIKQVIRTYDYFGRLGGEEFGVILPETDITNAFQLAERIRKTIEDLYIKDGLKITASIGLTILKPNDTPETIYERADKACYISKEERNKTSVL